MTDLSGLSIFQLGFFASLAASLGTGFGALPVLTVRSVSRKTQDFLLSAAAGVMLAAVAFSLVEPGITAAISRVGGRTLATGLFGLSFLCGAMGILLAHRYVPHEHLLRPGVEGRASRDFQRAWLLTLAMTLHNFPEGMAVGVGFGDGDLPHGLALTTGIFLQNLPEGFVVALALRALGYSRMRSVLLACATGVAEGIGGLVGAAAVSLSGAVLPWASGFAGGAMLFVVSHEIIPGTHQNGYQVRATFGLILGFVAMLLVTAALGG